MMRDPSGGVQDLHVRDRLLLEPYEARQYIVLADQPVALVGPDSIESLSWLRRLAVWMTNVAAVGASSSDGTAKRIIERTERAKSAGIVIRPVDRDQIQDLYFPPGHPRPRVVYVAHPFIKGRYVPMGAFHRVLFEQKVIEALELLACLGATQIEIQQVTGTEAAKEFAASLAIPGSTSVDAGTSRRTASNQGTEVLYSARLNPTEAPYIPADLQWYPHEKFWQSVAKLRLESGLLEFSLDVIYEDDFGVTTSITTKVLGVGFDLGSNYKDLASIKWQMRGTFQA